MSMNDQDTHLKFSHDDNREYSGYEKRHVPAEDPELTHTDPNESMGEFLRRFWQPVCMSEELTDVPKAIKIMGEELVAFRDKSGQVGVLHRHCAHRGCLSRVRHRSRRPASAAATTASSSTWTAG